jgi:hypothetical protein
MKNADITTLIEDFAKQIIVLTEAAAAERVQTAIAAAFGAPVKRDSGRSSKLAVNVASSAAKRRPMKVTAKVARARKLQGQYLGALRGLGQADRAKVRTVAQDKGVPEALKLATSLKKSKK